MAKEIKIKYQGKGFWIYPDFIELLSQYICSRFETNELNTYNERLRNVYDDCDANRKGSRIGMVGFLFDDDIQNSTDKNTFIGVLQETKNDIAALGSELSISALNEFESNKSDDYFKSPWALPVKTQSLIGTIDIIIDLLNGNLQYDNYLINYQGFPVIPGAIIV